MLKTVYKDLFDLAGTSGYEKDIRTYMRNQMAKYSNYEIVTDRLGSIFAVKKAKDTNASVVMVAGHMDEVGLIVVSINEFGMLKF